MSPLSRPPTRVPAPPARMTAVIESRPGNMARIVGLKARGLLLRVTLQSSTLFDLAVGQRILAPRVRVRAVAEIETHRRADETETLAEVILEIAFVRIGQ